MDACKYMYIFEVAASHSYRTSFCYFCSTEIGQISIGCEVPVQQFLSWTGTPVNIEVVRVAELTFVFVDFFVRKNDI